MRVHACMHVHVRACVGVAPTHPHPHPPTHPPPRGGNTQNSEISICTWSNQDNSILFEKSLPLNIPELI